MARLILLLVLFAGAVLAVVAVLAAFGLGRIGAGVGGGAGPGGEPERGLPGPLRTIAYVLLFLLMLGVTTGWLGGA